VKLLYIAGYGRSGSSVLALLLSQDPDIVSLGEVGAFYRAVQENATCTCGALIEDCTFWGPLAKSVRVNSDSPNKSESREVALRRVVDYAWECSGASILIDSSKTAWFNGRRPLQLIACGYDVRVLHLVRDLRGVMRSMKAGRNSAIESGLVEPAAIVRTLWSVIGWTVANAAATFYGLLAKRKYRLLTYKTVIQKPEAALKVIGGLIERDLTGLTNISLGQVPMRSAHEIRGNRVLRSGSVLMKHTPIAGPASGAGLA